MKKETKKKKLCILGTAWSCKDAPFQDPDYDFWGVAHCLMLPQIPKMDAVFEIHLKSIWEKELDPRTQKPIIHNANNKSIKTYLQEVDSEIPTSEKFPIKELTEKYRKYIVESDYFYATNSIVWMIILGIDLGYEQIDMYGVHLECDQEWAFERPCVEYWLGVAAGLGIKVNVATAADVCRGSHLYGYAEIEIQRKKILSRVEGFNSRLNDMNRQRIIMMQQLMNLENELQLTSDAREEMIKKQFELINSEISIIAEKGKDEYNNIVKNKITDSLKKINAEVYELDKRINAVNGAKEDSEYFLKQLNA